MTFRYLKFCEIGTAVGNEFEDVCFTALKERVLGFTMKGTPVGCILVELLLSGNGLQLSERFCKKLRHFCTRMGIAIVADEILTGFRCASKPTVLFSDRVGLIPAPKGVRRLLIKILHGGEREQRLFRRILTSVKTDGDALTIHVLEFQHVINQTVRHMLA